MNSWDRFTSLFAPKWTLQRVQARSAAGLLAARGYDAASHTRRTSNWGRNRGDANALLSVALEELRIHSRALVRNNGWAKRGQNVIVNNVVGWGNVPKPTSANAKANTAALALWKQWAGSTECDSSGALDFVGLQALAMRAIVTDGEVLIRRRWRRVEDKLSIPMQLEVLEADFLDTRKNGMLGVQGGPIINGVEFDPIGRRVAYWIFEQHPGSQFQRSAVSRRVPASEIRHVHLVERPGQCRGASWLGTAIVTLKELDEYEAAELVKQRIAACFAAFVTDTDGTASPLGEQTAVDVETFEPGMIHHLAPGKNVTIAAPPQVTTDTFTTRTLRKVAAGLGITYEDLSGDYSQVNYSSARMGRLVHQANVRTWQSQMLIPQFCAPIWGWAMEAATASHLLSEAPPAEWTAPPLPMIEPDKEGLGLGRLVRVGALTPSEMIREQGGDPEAHWAEYAADLKVLDALGIKLDSDVRAVSQAGLTQERAGLQQQGPTEKPI